jgi:hypothetical protein
MLQFLCPMRDYSAVPPLLFVVIPLFHTAIKLKNDHYINALNWRGNGKQRDFARRERVGDRPLPRDAKRLDRARGDR